MNWFASSPTCKSGRKILGVFTNDRELLECPRCGLLEDVTSTGLLITCRANALDEDTGLRFVPLADNLFRCPSCARRVEALVDELEQTRKKLEVAEMNDPAISIESRDLELFPVSQRGSLGSLS